MSEFTPEYRAAMGSLSVEDAVTAIVVEAIESWGPTSNAPLFTARILAVINVDRAAAGPSPSLLRAWASDPKMFDSIVLERGFYTYHFFLNALADALERSLSPDAKVAQIVERAEEEKP